MPPRPAENCALKQSSYWAGLPRLSRPKRTFSHLLGGLRLATDPTASEPVFALCPGAGSGLPPARPSSGRPVRGKPALSGSSGAERSGSVGQAAWGGTFARMSGLTTADPGAKEGARMLLRPRPGLALSSARLHRRRDCYIKIHGRIRGRPLPVPDCPTVKGRPEAAAG